MSAEGDERYRKREDCECRHRDLDSKIQEIFSLLDIGELKFSNLSAWMKNIDRKQNWILGVLITLLLTIIGGLCGILYVLVGG